MTIQRRVRYTADPFNFATACSSQWHGGHISAPSRIRMHVTPRRKRRHSAAAASHRLCCHAG